MYTGELISLGVAISWTATALFAEVASKRMGSLTLNVIRMSLSLTFLAITLWVTLGVPYPPYADRQTWIWLSLSGFVGYVLGDYCLFRSYILMTSRFGQLFMTLASPTAALAAWLLLGEAMQPLAIIGMLVTITGIGLSIMTKGGERNLSLKLPIKGVLYGIGAGMGQGLGLVLSKIGMQHYEDSLALNGILDMTNHLNEDALLPVSFGFMMPFASTMIRAIIGLLGFIAALCLFSADWRSKLKHGVTDSRAMTCTLGASIFGPFVGVSLSLMATLYTDTGIAQTIMAMTPVFILIPSWLMLHQKVTWLEVAGACISVCGVALFFI